MKKLVLALGSNLGNCLLNLKNARHELELQFGQYEASQIFISDAVDYQNQPDFYNQVLVFDLPQLDAKDVLLKTMNIENELGRQRSIRFGPRTIDIDIIFYADQKLNLDHLIIPHPRFLQRSFVVYPLLELSIKSWLLDNYSIPDHFEVAAKPIV